MAPTIYDNARNERSRGVYPPLSGGSQPPLVHVGIMVWDMHYAYHKLVCRGVKKCPNNYWGCKAKNWELK